MYNSETCGDNPHQNCAAVVGSERVVKDNVRLLGMRAPDIVRAAVFKELRGALEQWSGEELVPTQGWLILIQLTSSMFTVNQNLVLSPMYNVTHPIHSYVPKQTWKIPKITSTEYRNRGIGMGHPVVKFGTLKFD